MKVFRKQRQQLAADNNVIKYLRYAIGEILLVVIGILIALQVNNWNQDYKNARQELFYLQKLQENIAEDTSLFKERINEINEAQEALKTIAMEMRNPSLKSFSIDISGPLTYTYGISLENATWKNLMSTGKIDLIENKNLVDTLYSYYNHFSNNGNAQNQAVIDYTRNTVGPFLMKFDDISFLIQSKSIIHYLGKTQQKSPYEYGKNVFIRNTIRLRYSFLSYLKSFYKSDNKRASHLIHELSQEIQKSQ
ncbi:MAG: hypothetical protein JXR90_00890 [Spirochaetes bacterium]|nr:hypothetical protein [Spirochaetota bacterium]